MTRPTPAGDFDYEAKGHGYARRRRTEPRIARLIHDALGDARTVINVGAGSGSYEPQDRYVIAVEPSANMRSQRSTPAVDAVAEHLPFDADSFDAGLAIITIHQWPDLARGLNELRRVTKGPIVIMSFTDDTLSDFWLNDYVPEMIAPERTRMPSPAVVAEILGGATIRPVPIPFDCIDGFIEAYYGRPEAFLHPEVRAAQSVWANTAPEHVERGTRHLEHDLESGAWDARYGHLRTQPEYIGSLRMIVA